MSTTGTPLPARGIMVPFVPQRPQHILPFAALAQWTGTALWQGQSAVSDPHQTFAYAASQGFGTPVGTSVSLMPFAHPIDAAMKAGTLAGVTGHPVTVGFGPGATSLQRGLLGRPYRSPLTAVREYVDIVRRLLTTGQADVAGTYYTCRMNVPVTPRPRVDIGLGVLRPGMAELAGEIADTAICWLTPAAYLREVIRPALERGAARAGRPVPRLVAMVPVALERADRDPIRVALASNTGHMQLPHYVDMLQRAGIPVDVDNEPEQSAKALIAGGAFLSGTPAQVGERLAEYAQVGVDEVVFNLTGVAGLEGHPAALRDLETLVEHGR